ncbi:TonB-dependent receptor family protein [Collimonas humicola]|uniref:TonB-dependent receptor family protein n=1 Tax=Collimonas humicola TaxID=2825886 RepID=UPI001B8C6D28|nr:TonB-dependent siderophore receptor [Collimonas humicola]
MAVLELPQTLNTPRLKCSAAVALALAVLALPATLHAQQVDSSAAAEEHALESIQVSGDWLGTGLQNSVKRYPGARTVVKKEDIENSGAASIGDVMRRIPGVQVSDNSSSAGSSVSLNIGVRGLAGRFSPRSTVLLDGIPLAVAPYGQPQLSFAPVSLNNIEAIDVVRGAGSVRFGPQNVGGIINFKTRSIPTEPGFNGDASVRTNNATEAGGANRQYSAFVGSQLDNGLGLAVLYSGVDGSGWRADSGETVNDFALKYRYQLTPGSEIYGKLSYYDVRSQTPGGLSAAQYAANPFQNTRPTDFWSGTRKGADVGYLNTISDTQEFEIRTYYNESFRQSTLISGKVLGHQPRTYQTLGIEPRYTQRFNLGGSINDVTVGYRYIRETGNDLVYNSALGTGIAAPPSSSFDNFTGAHAVYIDDKIALGDWRITPGIRYEHIRSTRTDVLNGPVFPVANNKALPSLSVAYLLSQNLTLFGNYSTSFGPVQNTQLNAAIAGNPLVPEVAKTAEIGARWKSRQLSAEITAFDIRFDNQIQQVAGSSPAVFQNIGATRHDGIETAIDYAFDKAGALAGLNLYANYTYTRALQKSGPTAGLDVPFYSRNTDTIGARYTVGAWGFDLSSTHQSRQFADNANTIAESANGGNGEIPGFRTWNAQASWKVPGLKGAELLAGVNNLADKRYFTRTTDSNIGKLVGAPRTVYVQGRIAF